MRSHRNLIWALLAPMLPGLLQAAEFKKVATLRAPQGGIQPQAAVDEKNRVHLIYFCGDPKRGDIFYVRSEDSAAAFSEPLRVNGQPGSAIAIGNIRGAHLALGKNGRPHVAWMGSDRAEPKAPGGEAPMLYARLSDHGGSFEPQRNVIQARPGLDGGGTLAADDQGNVYVLWHAPDQGPRGEANRRVWISRSSDEGKTFSRESPALDLRTGACGCCGMRAAAGPGGSVFVLYRAARENVHRDMVLLGSRDAGKSFRVLSTHPWEVEQCVMSTASFAAGPQGILAGWETLGQVYFSKVDPKSLKCSAPFSPPLQGKKPNCKHPALAANSQGETILVWTEGMGWERGGKVAWQVFGKDGKPLPAEKGQADGVPPWSLVAAFPRPDGGFTVIY